MEKVADYRLRQYLAERLHELRGDTKWKQEEIAKEIGRTQAQVSRYESGQRLVPAEDLARIARLLQVPVQEFFPPDLSDHITQGEAELVRAYRKGDYSEVLKLIAKKLAK